MGFRQLCKAKVVSTISKSMGRLLARDLLQEMVTQV
jgi:hypothetical protein